MIALALLLSLSPSLFALTIDFVGPCEEPPFYFTRVEASEALDVGTLSIEILKGAEIPFVGSEFGIKQILDSPVGLEAIEIISEREMLSYGWCFEVDGLVAELYPNEVKLKGVQHIRWFFGYAHYEGGEWSSQCQKSYLRRADFLCE